MSCNLGKTGTKFGVNSQMSCNLGKTGTRFVVNSQVFVILFWFLVDISNSRQEQKMRGTRGTRFSKVFIRVLIVIALV